MSQIPTEQLTIFSDSEARSRSEDRLRFSPIARSICTEIERWKHLHSGLVIGIYGPWGSGKTSLMRLVQFMLDGKDQPPATPTAPASLTPTPANQPHAPDEYFTPTRNYLSIWFSAWRYDKRDDVWIALLRTILAGIQAKHNWLQRRILGLKLWLARLNRGAVIALLLKYIAYVAIVLLVFQLFSGLGSSIKPAEPGVQAQISGWMIDLKSTATVIEVVVLLLGLPVLFARPLFNFFRGSLDIRLSDLTRKTPEQDYAIFVDDVRRDFANLLRAVGREKTVVVFIDDLDRCSSDQVVPILEAVKQFTEPPDPRDSKQPQQSNTDPNKPNILFVIGADREAIEHVVKVRYEKSAPADEQADWGKSYLEKIIQVSIDLPHLGISDVRGYVEGLLGGEARSPDFDRETVEFFSQVLPDNPRLIKHVLNDYLLRKHIALERFKTPATTRDVWRLLPLVSTLRYLFKQVYQQLWSYPNLLADLLQLALYKYDGQEEITSLGCPTVKPETALIEKHGFDNPALLTVLRVFKASFFSDLMTIWIDPREVLAVLQLDLAAQPAAVVNITADLLSGDPTKIARVPELDRDAPKIWARRLLNMFGAPDPALQERAMFALARIAPPGTVDFNTAVELLARTVLMESSDKNLRVIERAMYALFRMSSKHTSSERAQQVVFQIVTRAASDLSLGTLALRRLYDLPAPQLTEQTRTNLLALYMQEDYPTLSGEAKNLIITHRLADEVAAALAKAMT